MFPEDAFESVEDKKVSGEILKEDTTIVKQIKYSINFLAQTGHYIMDEHVHLDKMKQI